MSQCYHKWADNWAVSLAEKRTVPHFAHKADIFHLHPVLGCNLGRPTSILSAFYSTAARL